MAVVLTELAQDDDYVKLFKGYNILEGGGEGMKECISWLAGKPKDERAKIMIACIIFTEKPSDLLLTGLSKNMARKGKTKKSIISVEIAKFLPKIKKVAIDAMEPRPALEMKMRRKEWPMEFQLVNMSMVLRCAYMMLQYVLDSMPKVGLDWIKLHGGNRPLEAVVPDKFVGESRKIRQAGFDKFKMEHDIVAADSDFTVLNALG